MAGISEEYLIKMPWYMKGSRTDAEKVLATEDAGSFVIRPSSQKNCLALSHKVSDGSIGHALIHSTPQGYRLEQTQNAFPSLELLVLSIKKHFTISDSLSGLGMARTSAINTAAAKSGGAAGSGGGGRLSANDPNRTTNLAQLGEMFPGESRESMVTAMQLANGDTEKAADLMLQGELHESNDAAEAAKIVQQLVPTLGPRVERVRDAVLRITSYQELKQKVGLGKAVAEIKKSLVPFPNTSSRARPAELPPGPPGTTEEQLVRFKNTINHSVWEILAKFDTLHEQLQAGGSAAIASRQTDVLSALGAVSQALAEVEPLLGDGGGGGGGG
eukprot:CAMPEP_0198335936 /NCGR_PEP_ID=MMETSP1450-20131203/20645_1 /TAXON_ID=753684 ORGANISM="Madagascaria erythrocladiodes, Strain CCMP3234" /NCGR_SAMPLE_ID=MMETSP1450 /ASSEMBLY_ACC=CAM_ASM_001115 /LENGTH=329 /DNA_ID=CAMNT_0044040631 /DNA_START=137 /DNA_END=1123 /DNA_ORIENTATION=+